MGKEVIQEMNILTKIKHGAIEATGKTLIAKHPMYLVYHPEIHKVRGKAAWGTAHFVQPCDILLRRFDGYLNTIFTELITNYITAEDHIKGFWGHAGFYVGDYTMVHSVSKGCIREHVLDFLRADAIAVLRIPGLTYAEKRIMLKIANLMADAKVPYDLDFIRGNWASYCCETVNTITGGIYDQDYVMFGKHEVLLPDAMFHSEASEVVLTINYEGRT